MASTYVSGSPVPAVGGNLYYAIWAQNQNPIPMDWDGWIDMIYLPGTPSADTITVVAREITNFLPGWQINRPDVWYPVPGSWPGGDYELRIYSGWYPEYIVWYTDAFDWEKEGAVDLDFEAKLPTAGFPDPFGDIALTQEDFTVPTELEVHGAHPNPFNQSTTFSFALPEAAQVKLRVYNLQGRVVATLLDGLRNAGSHDITFDASHLASGIYLYRFTAGEQTINGKMILIK